MKSVREILEDLARHSHQAKGTNSYYPIVEKALSEIDAYRKSKVPKNIAKIIVDKFADLMLPEKERLNELEFMITQAMDDFYKEE